MLLELTVFGSIPKELNQYHENWRSNIVGAEVNLT